MIRKMLKWVDKNEDTLIQVYSFGFAIVLALCMISLRFIF